MSVPACYMAAACGFVIVWRLTRVFCIWQIQVMEAEGEVITGSKKPWLAQCAFLLFTYQWGQKTAFLL